MNIIKERELQSVWRLLEFFRITSPLQSAIDTMAMGEVLGIDPFPAHELLAMTEGRHQYLATDINDLIKAKHQSMSGLLVQAMANNEPLLDIVTEESSVKGSLKIIEERFIVERKNITTSKQAVIREITNLLGNNTL